MNSSSFLQSANRRRVKLALESVLRAKWLIERESVYVQRPFPLPDGILQLMRA